MKTFTQGLLLGSILLTTPAFTCSVDGKSGFLPENKMKIPVNSKLKTGITEEQFNAVIDRYEAVYKPIVAAQVSAG